MTRSRPQTLIWPDVRDGSSLCENSLEPRTRRIVFSIAFSEEKSPVQSVSTTTKLRQKFYAQVQRRSFHTAWVRPGRRTASARSQLYPGGLNRSMQHFILKKRW